MTTTEKTNGPTPEQVAAELRNKEEWQAAEVALLLPEITAVLLEQINKEMQLVGTLNTGFARASVESGKQEVDAAKVTAAAAIAAAPATFAATAAMSHVASQASPELEDLNDQHKALTEELKGVSSGVRVGVHEAPMRSKEEIQADIGEVDYKRGEERDRRARFSQLPQAAGDAAGKIVSGAGAVTSAQDQMAAKISQAEATIYSAEASYMKELYTQAVQMIQAFRNINPYESQAAAVRG